MTTQNTSRVDELIAALNALKINDTGSLEEDIPTEIMDQFPEFDPENTVMQELDPEEHRWFIYSTTVLEVSGEFIGVMVISSVKSESMSVSDCDNTLEFFKMKKVVVESYEAV